MNKISIDPKEYVVFDIETNGLSSRNDDILSISFFKPDDGKTYSRFLPLELSKVVKTTEKNGITKENLEGAIALKQKDIDFLFEEFELDKRTILIYAPLDGFDDNFLYHYMKRKFLKGFEKLKFYNFKNQMISSAFSHGNVTKDNLCRMFDISGVRNVHSGINDCRLEWELFTRLKGDYYFITEGCPYDNVFRLTDDYIVPVSYFYSHPNLKNIVKRLPDIECETRKVYNLHVNFNSMGIKKFPTNFNGMIIEHLLNRMLEVNDVHEESRKFLLENKSKLGFVGKIPSAVDTVPMHFNEDGTFTAIQEKDIEKSKELNNFVSVLKPELIPLVLFIKNDIFEGKQILSQELVIDKDFNVLALCDLSSENAVLEIKTNSFSSEKYKNQLYFQSRRRKCYHLSLEWKIENKTNECEELVFTIYEVSLSANFDLKEQIAKTAFVKKGMREKIQDRLAPLGFELVYYLSSSDPIKVKCNKCGCEMDAKYSSIYAGTLKCMCLR